MKKAYYIVGAVFLGVGTYFLYNKIKNGNVSFNFRNEDVADTKEGSHLEPPMESTIKIPSLATNPIV